MDAFRFTSVVLSTVLGLGVARILSGFVAAFKARGRVRQDWLPLLLAGVILAELLQFWWAIAELSVAKTWTLASFTLLVGLIVMLFLAAALIVPAESVEVSPRKAFERDGRWALAVLACYHLAAIIANRMLFNEPLAAVGQVILLGQAAVALAIALVSMRRWQEVLAVVYVAASVTDTLVASQLAYG